MKIIHVIKYNQKSKQFLITLRTYVSVAMLPEKQV